MVSEARWGRGRLRSYPRFLIGPYVTAFLSTQRHVKKSAFNINSVRTVTNLSSDCRRPDTSSFYQPVKDTSCVVSALRRRQEGDREASGHVCSSLLSAPTVGAGLLGSGTDFKSFKQGGRPSKRRTPSFKEKVSFQRLPSAPRPYGFWAKWSKMLDRCSACGKMSSG